MFMQTKNRRAIIVDCTVDWQTQSRRLLNSYPKYARCPLALVDIRTQKLYLVKALNLCGIYPISTSRYGIGSIEDSYKTPQGVHRVAMKIGADEPLCRCFEARRASDKIASLNRYATIGSEDTICTRILWLAGLEPRINQGGYHDSERRYIYIHGTADEKRIGRPSSIGCIRMKNLDVIEVFNTLQRNSIVRIIPPAPARIRV